MPDRPAHLTHLARALATEAAAQRAEIAEARARPLDEQVAQGVAWASLRGDGTVPAGRDHLRWLLRAPRGQVLHDGLGPGARVDVGRMGNAEVLATGRVVGTGDRWVEVRVPLEEAPDGVFWVAERFDPTTFERYQRVLAEVDPTTPLARALLEPAPVEDTPRELPDDLASGLNEAQRAAARHALGAPQLAVVQGPPGTGKTRLLSAVMVELVRRQGRVWALADSNAATDHLARSAAGRGLRVVRVGPPSRIGEDVVPLTLQHRLAHHRMAPAWDVLERDLSRLRAEGGPGAGRRRRELYQERDRLRRQARDEILQGADVLATTFGTGARVAPTWPEAITAVVDEATQALEPAVWSVVDFVQRLVLVGDPNQLGPVVISHTEALAESLLHRLVATPTTAVTLTVQHRMHQAIQALVEGVYGPTYGPHPSVAEHTLADLAGVARTDDTTTPVRFIDTAGAGLDEQRDPATGSTANPGEADVVARVVARWLEQGLASEQIAVIAPYSAQVAVLRADPRLQGVEVDTVNAFQGREAEAVVVSFVRSNPDGVLGFVDDRRRLTVAITRARRAWVGVGDSATLSSSALFSDLLERVAAVGAHDSVWVPPWDEALSWDADGA